jgi:hypothetical protein
MNDIPISANGGSGTSAPFGDLEALNLAVIRGEAGGRVIWQPRILAWYYERLFLKQPLPAPFEGMTLPQIYRTLGCSNRIYDYYTAFVWEDDPRVRIVTTDVCPDEYETRIETPVGAYTARYRRAETTSWHVPIKWPVTNEQEMRAAAWRYEHMTVRFDREKYDAIRREWAGLGVPCSYFPRTTIQKLFIEDMGTEETVFALLDYPAACERYFEALAVMEDRFMDALIASPIVSVSFGDNIHSSLTSPEMFVRYILPVYHRRIERLRPAGKFLHSHWDGNVKPLLPLARETGLDGLEAITPLPQGDVTLEEVKAALGDMFLLDGIPAVFFDATYSERDLKECVQKCLDLFAPRLILGISDELSFNGLMERVRLVGEMVEAAAPSGGIGAATARESSR